MAETVPFPLENLEKSSWLNLVRGEGNQSLIRHHVVAPSRDVSLPPLRFGEALLKSALINEAPQGFSRKRFYVSASLGWFGIQSAVVYGPAGVVAVPGHVIAASLNHTSPGRDAYTIVDGGGITLFPQRIRSLPGLAYTIEFGAYRNYYHWLIDCIGRLAPLRSEMQGNPGPLIVPPLSAPYQHQTLQLLDWLKPTGLIELRPREAMIVPYLMVPDTVSGSGWNISPNIATLFDQMTANAVKNAQEPKSFYIDRSGASRRPMSNERELIASLRTLGIEPIVLESLDISEQIGLFYNARLIVGSHGAGLANLTFSRAGCRVVEIFSGSYVNWCFRSIAASRGLSYDAVVCVTPREVAGPIHTQEWQASVDDVMQAVRSALA